MRPLFRGEGCAINEAGISTAGNPLTRAFDAVTNDPLHARQLREGYLAGMRPPMGGLGLQGHMLDPMMGKPGGALEHAWQEIGPMRHMMPMGPALGAPMPEQLLRHLQRPPGMELQDPGFFMDGPLSMPRGSDPGAAWASEFAVRPPPGQQPGPGMMMQRPLGPAEWAGEFARPQFGPHHGAAEMEAAFHQAQLGAPRFPEAQMLHQSAGPLGGPLRPMLGLGEGPLLLPLRPLGHSQAMHGPGQQDMQAAFQEAQMEAAFAEAQQAQADQADLGQAAQMVEMLRNSGNPKFANSQFVSFIDKVSKGDLQFKENTVIDRNGNEVDWDSLYDTAAATATDTDRRELETFWEASGGASSSGLEGVWAKSARSEAETLEKAWGSAEPRLEDAWQAAEHSGADMERLWTGAEQHAMDDAWKVAGEDAEAAMLERAWLGEDFGNMDQIFGDVTGASNTDYKFQQANKYLDCDDPLAEAQRLLKEGRDREALLALEAEVQRNPESSEGWRQLGQLYAELDQDVEAIQCLRKGHEVDPYNLDSLLALGVSCTNELDQLPALRYLRLWIENHEEHQVFAQGLQAPPEYDYEAWRQQVTALFNQAAQANPLDANVFVALGVMENINRNYEAAIQALATACRLRPNDHTVWNKLGATLANSGKSEQAVVAYHQGLQLKPNYARSWSNLAIAHANLGQHADAARFYLSSLVLNPEATHIWNFLHSAVLNMNNVNTLEMRAIDQRDLEACTKVIDGVLDPMTLPKPTQELPLPPDEILASIGL